MRKRILISVLVLLGAGMACSLPGLSDQPTQPTPPSALATLTKEIPAPTAPSATMVLTPTAAPTSVPQSTLAPLLPSPIPSATSAPIPLTSYYLQSGTPVGMQNFANPSAGCKWMGIAGQVFNISGEPVSNFVLEVGGILGGKSVSQMALTGAAPLVGPGGYLITLADHPIESDGSMWIQLYDEAGAAKTGKILLTTYPDCQRNLILINLVELHTLSTRVLIPLLLENGR